jgi:hypothetical protein
MVTYPLPPIKMPDADPSASPRIKSGASFAWKGLGGLAGAGDIERDFAGAGSRILHAARDLAGCRILTFDRRRKFDHRPERKRILQIRIAGIKRA